MPGTIRVSVLEFMDLPELLPSPISIKVSMGKRLYESSDKGDFSFPLTTLRDDVILIIQDAGGSEISRAGVQAKSIVEKGYWDDLFPLEGGGRVHLQLQFALSEDDRSRIRMMRETAMRRKQVEHQDRNLKSSGSSLASSLYLNPELSDSQKCLLQVGDLSAKESAHQSSSTENIHDEKPVTEKTDDNRLDLVQPLSVENDADRNKDSPTENIHHEKKPVTEKTDEIRLNLIQPLSVENDADRNKDSPSTENSHHDEKPVTEKTDDIRLDLIQPLSVENDADRNTDSPSTIPLLQEVDVKKPKVNKTQLVERIKTQSPHLSKPSPTIRSEENLFRSQGSELSNSPANDEEKTDSSAVPPRRRTPNKVKSVINAFESSLTQDPKPHIKPSLKSTQHSVVENQTSLKVNRLNKGTTIDPPLVEELTHDIHQKEQKRNFIDASDGTKLSEDPRQSHKLKEKENLVGGENMSEKCTTDKKRDDIDAKHDESDQKSEPETPDYDRNSVTGESVSHVKDEQFPSKRSGGWIVPDERRRLCVTTGGNQMLDMVGGRTSYTFSRKGEMKISMEENRRTSETNANEGKNDHQKMIKPESSDDVKPSEGPLANAFKIALMVGFGTLVLLTRQRKKKK